MDFEINEIVLFCSFKSRIVGWNNHLEQYIIHRFEEAVGWCQGCLSFYDKKGKQVNKDLTDLTNLWYVHEKSITKLDSEIVDETQLEKEDLTMEKLILKKLIKLQKIWNLS